VPADAFVLYNVNVGPQGVGQDPHVLYTVPAGKILVTDSVSATVDTQSDSIRAAISLTAGGSSTDFALPLVHQSPGSTNHYVSTIPPRAYAGPGTTVLVATTMPAFSSGTASFSMSGHLVNAPPAAS
jgi:hypothetical protein